MTMDTSTMVEFDGVGSVLHVTQAEEKCMAFRDGNILVFALL